MNKTKKKRYTGLWLLLSLLLIAGAGGFVYYKVFGPNTGDLHQGEYLYIPTGASYLLVYDELINGGYIDDPASFDILAHRANYPASIKPGKYKVPKGISNYELIRKLRSGKQEPVKLVINKLRTKADFIQFVSARLEPDSAAIAAILSDNELLKTYGFDTTTALAAIIPDTYEFYWNTGAEKVYARLVDYYNRFWTEDRKQQAFARSLTPLQVMVLASIVEEETNRADERATVASVYLNRLKFGMKLQADPTVKFAVNDFALKRILNIHLEFDSPYNTYLYAGLPPGPITTPSKSSIEAVLNAKETDYIYFCAKEDFSGYHNFASNYKEHMKNAREYQKALNENGIK
ncbi:MAG: endolytic transglycosylase MltG [Chitinophagales bacterium]|nr:endolytic transglycosylase MltG [Chitinophagales bacterium]